MGFTGKKAMEFKEGYIEAFNKMETELLQKYEQPALPSTITPEQKLAIRDAIGAKVYADYPEGKRQLAFSAEYKKFYHAFAISKYGELPVDKFEEAIEWLQGVVIAPKAIKQEVAISKPILRNRQFLYSYDSSGVESIDEILGDKILVESMNFKALVNRVELLAERYRKIIEVENNMFLAQQAATKAYISMMDFRVSTCDPVREANMLADSLGK